MMIELNKHGFLNLLKFNLSFDEDSNINSFVSIVSNGFISEFLSANEVYLDDRNQITDGSQIYGSVKPLN